MLLNGDCCFFYFLLNICIVLTGVTVPMYILTVHKAGEFLVEVHQEDVRCAGAKEYIDVGVSIMKADETYGARVAVRTFLRLPPI